MTVGQTVFRDALLDPDCDIPKGLSDGGHRPADKRFNVYRNNVTVSLMEAMNTGFPMVIRIIGRENMDGLTRMFVRAHPPTSQLMMHYGDRFPDFLSEIPQLAHLGYLPDVARLDLSVRRSYHASDAEPMDPADLATDSLMECSLRLAPALQLLRSDWPLYDIWRFNTQKDAPQPNPVAQDVLVVRPDYDPEPHLLPDGGATWISALQNGQSVGDALDLVHRDLKTFDLTTMLTLLITGQALISLTKKD